MTVLIVGGGFLGAELARQGHAADRQTAATFHSHPGGIAGVTWHRFEVRNPASTGEILDAVSPTAVVNASSGGAEWVVTADGGMRLAQAAAERGNRLVHVSSDAVFSDRRRDQYDEMCLPDPVTPYGAAKAAAETAVRLLSDGAVVAPSKHSPGQLPAPHVCLIAALFDSDWTSEDTVPALLA
ncbi:sugar nucleotide-binding protein [Streptomyces longwoodensis]|uniref:sugar nucleotide-binding protein n=1 Tax=Streptomyces longwoodensis TaxID=68231 RepID=UPI0033BFBC4D